MEERIKLLSKELKFLKDTFLAHAGPNHGMDINHLGIRELFEDGVSEEIRFCCCFDVSLAYYILYSRVECGFFLIGQNRSCNERSGMILEVQIQNFCKLLAGAYASKFSFLKNSQGLKYQYFFVKIGMKLPFKIKNKHKNTNMKFEFKSYFILTTKEKPHKKMFVHVSALIQLFKTIDTQLLFCSQFLKMHQKSY